MERTYERGNKMSALEKFDSYLIGPSHLTKPDYIMLYGLPGSGKSTLAASIADVPEYSPVLIISTEGGLKGILNDYTDDQIKVLEVTTHEGFNQIFQAVIDDDAAGVLPYKTVILDVMDVAFTRALEHYSEVEEAKAKPDSFKKWAQVGEWENGVSRGMKDASFLAITVLHSKRTKNENGPYEDNLALAGAAKDRAAGVPDIVGFTVRENRKTTLYVGSSNNRSTKSRFENVLPDEIENPTMKGILDIISPKKKTATKEAK